MNSKVVKKLKKILAAVAFVVLIVAVTLFVAVSIFNRNKNKPTFLFGYALLWVETGSMETTIPERSFILVKAVDGENLSVGTVITFVCNDKASPVYGNTVTHRIVEIIDGGYRTRGDNGNTDLWVVAPQDVVAEYVKNLPVTTVFGRIFLSSIGLVLIIALFVGSCAFIYVPDLISAVNGESDGQTDRDIEIEKRVKVEVLKMRERDRDGRNE